eukprot:11489173-Heterocapsa_arctica.AAC.1
MLARDVKLNPGICPWQHNFAWARLRLGNCGAQEGRAALRMQRQQNACATNCMSYALHETWTQHGAEQLGGGIMSGLSIRELARTARHNASILRRHAEQHGGESNPASAVAPAC